MAYNDNSSQCFEFHLRFKKVGAFIVGFTFLTLILCDFTGVSYGLRVEAIISAASASEPIRSLEAVASPHAKAPVLTEPQCTGDDDAPEINAAISRIRAQFTSGEHKEQYGELRLPAKQCVVRTTLNATGLGSTSVVIDGAGGSVLCKTQGLPCIDAMNSPRLALRDVSLRGSRTESSNIGLQVGRPAPEGSASGMYLDHVSINGYFEFAAFYNLNAETQLAVKLNASNDAPNAYGAVFDGINHWNARSQFVKVTEPVDVMQSFNDNSCLNCRITSSGTNGTPVWLGGTANLTFENSYISNFNSGPGAVIYGINTNPDFDAHFEAAGLTSVFVFDGATNVVLYGMKYREHDFFARVSLFAARSVVKTIKLQNAEIDIGRFHFPGRGAWFDDASKYALSGRITGTTSTGWVTPGGGFSGTACFGNLCKTY